MCLTFADVPVHIGDGAAWDVTPPPAAARPSIAQPGKGIKLDPMSLVLTVMPMVGLLLSVLPLALKADLQHRSSDLAESLSGTAPSIVSPGIRIYETVRSMRRHKK